MSWECCKLEDKINPRGELSVYTRRRHLESPGVTWSQGTWQFLTHCCSLASAETWQLWRDTSSSSPGLPHTCKGWGGEGDRHSQAGGTAMWTKIQINICSCLGKNENDVLTIFIFYFYLAAGLTGLTSTIFPWQNDKIKTVRTDPGLSRCDYQVLSSFVWRLNNWPSKYRNAGYFNLVRILWYQDCC